MPRIDGNASHLKPASLTAVLAGFLFVAAFGTLGALGSGAVHAKEAVKGEVPGGIAATVAVAELPRQGAETYGLIQQGGPFAYEKDGVVFGNRERLLPAKTRGYYREYTVKTTGSRDRGARRIVCGGQPKTPDVCYYTADHYASFRRIVP